MEEHENPGVLGNRDNRTAENGNSENVELEIDPSEIGAPDSGVPVNGEPDPQRQESWDDRENQEHEHLDNRENMVPPSMGFFDLVFALLVEPKKAMLRVAQDPPLWSGIIVFFIVTLLGSLVTALSIKYQPAPAPGELPVPFELGSMAPAIGIGGFVFSFIWLIITAGIYQITAELFGGRGRGLDTMTVVALTSLPNLFGIPFSLLFLVLQLPEIVSGLILGLISLGLFIWRVFLYVYGFREVHGLSTGRALAVLFLPMAVVIGLLVFLIFLMVIALLPYMNSL